MDGLQAAVLNTKLPYILKWTASRIGNASFYAKHLSGVDAIVLPKVRPDSKHTFHLYVIRAVKRDQLMNYLTNEGIETAIHYPIALPNLKAYKYLGHSENDFPIASKYQSEILSLPMFPELTEEIVVYVADKIKSFYKSNI